MAATGGFTSRPPQGTHQLSAQERLDLLEQRSLESTRNSVRVLDDTLRVGVDTAIELDRQGEQLNRIDERLDDIDADLVQSRRHLRQLRSVFGGIVNWFTKDKPVLTPTPDSGTAGQVEEARRLRQQVQERQAASGKRSSSVSGGGSSRSQLSYQSAHSEEIDENLGQLSSGLSRLTELALDMNDELAKQNHQIAGMSGRVGKLDMEVEALTKQTRRVT